MIEAQLMRRLLAESLGSAFLLATVVGSGVMGVKLAGGNVALALLANALATGAILVVLIDMIGPISGAHFNPAVTLALALRRDFAWRDAPAYILAQLLGAAIGVWTAHLMFDLPMLQIATTARVGAGQWLSEVIAMLGLLLIILARPAGGSRSIGPAIGLYIGSAYWFTASTAFANPAVTLARMLSDTFAGIAPANAPSFIAAQLAGALAAFAVQRALWPKIAVQPSIE